MKRTEKIALTLSEYITDSLMLEVACGTADFSIASCKFTKKTICIDITNNRLNPDFYKKNINFIKMDARNLNFGDGSFDCVVWYNALGHLEYSLNDFINESLRVLKNNGNLLIVSSFKMDKLIIDSNILYKYISPNKIRIIKKDGFTICIVNK